MISDRKPLLLGSGSPRRREILTTLRIPFCVATAPVDETWAQETPEDYLYRILQLKWLAVRKLPDVQKTRATLVADTIVLSDCMVLGKPVNAEDAFEMLRKLVGRVHEVKTGFAIFDHFCDQRVAQEIVTTKVQFRNVTDAALRSYIASGEGIDKAGAYAIQGLGSFLVKSIEGSYSNVVGLPSCELVEALERTGLASFPIA